MRLCLPALAILAAAGTPALAAPVLYSQSPLSGDASFVSNIGAANTEVAGDNVSFATDVVVSGLRWWGTAFDAVNITTPAAQPLTDAFSLRIGRLPLGAGGALDVVTTVALGDIAETQAPGFVDFLGAPVYEYALVLETPIALTAGDYLFSIYNNLDPGAYWTWSFALLEGETSFVTLDGGAVTGWEETNPLNPFFSGNFNMEIYGVSEPGALGLLSVGLAGLAALRRRRRAG
jgi:hypothetical protein